MYISFISGSTVLMTDKQTNKRTYIQKTETG